MSECHIFDGWCSVHGGRESCTASGQVPHLIARAEAAEAEVERLTAELAERDRRIAAALAYCDDWKPIAFAWSIQRILRGKS